MEVTGKIIDKFELQKGTSKAGNEWQKQLYLMEVNENNSQYPKKFVFDFFGSRVNEYPLEVGDTVTLSFDIESREFNGRWYTDIRGWRAVKVDGAAAPAGAAPGAAPVDLGAPAISGAPIAAGDLTDGGSTDDLPF